MVMSRFTSSDHTNAMLRRLTLQKREEYDFAYCCWRKSNDNHAYFAITQKLVHRPTGEHASQPGPSIDDQHAY